MVVYLSIHCGHLNGFCVCGDSVRSLMKFSFPLSGQTRSRFYTLCNYEHLQKIYSY